MTDLVERLRNPARGGGGDAYEAAAEIDRLRAALRTARLLIDQYYGQSAEPVMALIDAALGEAKA